MRNFRSVIQRTIDRTVAREIDAVMSFSIGGADGRFGYPAETQSMRDPVGRFFHVVGVNTPDDFTVAAP
jgi:hypothetical protein